MTIRKRLTIWYAALLTIIIILFGTITFAVMRFSMISNIDAALKETAHLIAVESDLNRVTTFGAPTDVYMNLAELDVFRASGVHVQAWKLLGEEPTLWGKSANLAPVDIPLNENALGYNGHDGHFSNVTIYGVDLRVLTTPVYLGDRLVGNIQVAADLQTVNEATDLLLLVMLISCGFAIVGAALLSLWFSHRALEPIDKITNAAARIAGTKDLSTRLDWQGPNDELGKLTSVFNQMMGRIEHLFSVQQRFVADISHELRTPLTAIQGNLELAKRYGMDDTSMEAVESEVYRMSRLVNDLLTLARADYGGIKIELEPIDLDTVVIETFEQCRILARNHNVPLKLGTFEPVRINGNSDRIKQIMLNLVGNALKFTDSDGEVVVSLEKCADEARLSVSDTGIGIAPDDLQRIFDRFYQSDPARTHTGGGFGLGLSIAKWLVDAHNGRIEVESQQGVGTTFTVAIPVYHPVETTDAHTQPTRPRIPIIRWNRDEAEAVTHQQYHHHHHQD